MANDAHLFHTRDDLKARDAHFDGWTWIDAKGEWLPLVQGMQLGHWDHRMSDVVKSTTAALRTNQPAPLSDADKKDANRDAVGVYWVASKDVAAAVPSFWSADWLLGFRSITIGTNARTFIPGVTPRAATGAFNTVYSRAPRQLALLYSAWASLAFDYLARQKLSGTNMSYFVVKQLACPTPDVFDQSPAWFAESLSAFIRPRALELSYTTWRLKGYAADIVDGPPGAPFRWLPERRMQIRAELDAAILHVYGIDREACEHILDSFDVLQRVEDRDLGEFRTKRLVLAAYDAMAEAAATGAPFVSVLDPPPGHGPRHPEMTSV
jgi:hypothetical protein